MFSSGLQVHILDGKASLYTSLKDIFPGGFGEVAQQVFHP